jgi:tetratricopeptide (TPR) repeat protein
MFFIKNKNKPIKYIRKGYTCDEKNNTNSALKEIMISYIGETRKIVNDEVILQCKNSKHPLDILAIAFAYEHKGANFRKEAIQYFEKFLENPCEIPKEIHLTMKWIYSPLAILYEKEYNFEKAIFYLEKMKQEDIKDKPLDKKLENTYFCNIATAYRRIGEIKIKQGMDIAKNYCDEIKKDKYYKNKEFKRVIDHYIKDVEDKITKGYVYKPKYKK